MASDSKSKERRDIEREGLKLSRPWWRLHCPWQTNNSLFESRIWGNSASSNAMTTKGVEIKEHTWCCGVGIRSRCHWLLDLFRDGEQGGSGPGRRRKRKQRRALAQINTRKRQSRRGGRVHHWVCSVSVVVVVSSSFVFVSMPSMVNSLPLLPTQLLGSLTPFLTHDREFA